MRFRQAAWPGLGLLSFACAAVAQQTGTPDPSAATVSGSSGVTAYAVGFFTELGAVNGLEMVRQIPGFSFDNAENARGYAGTGGNVLIDGRRPSTKTTRLNVLLQRIPDAAIERIEVIRGGAHGIDMQGLPVVANIVRKSGAFDTGTVQGVGKFYPDGEVGAILRLERLRQTETMSLEGFLEAREEKNDEEAGDGPIRVFDPDGNVIEDGTYEADAQTRRIRGLGTLERQTAGGLFRGNVALAHDLDDKTEVFDLADANGAESLEVVDKDRSSTNVEIGADYDGSLDGGYGFQVVALQSLEWDEDDSTGSDGIDILAAEEEEKSGETILRGLLRKELSPQSSLEAGAEGAFNFLDNNSTLTVNGQPVVLPSSDVRVEELRGEIYSTLTTKPSERSTVELGLRGEMSSISVSGDSEAENDFAFLKPRIVATYSSDSGRQFRVRIEREVGQLDFGDFAAGSEIGDGTIDAGNPDLAPEHAWVYEAAVEQPFLDNGNLALTYRYYDISDVVDLIPIEGFAAPGNIGDGTRHEVEVSISLPLDAIGPGLGRLQLSGTWRESEVVDPFTGEKREISGEAPFEGSALYTRDFPSMNSTFGIRGELASEETAYRVTQIITDHNEHYWRVYWDWRARSDLQFRFQLENATSRDLRRVRVRYDGPRGESDIESVEVRSAGLDPLLVARVRWTF